MRDFPSSSAGAEMLAVDVTEPAGWVGWLALVVSSGLAGGFLGEMAKSRIARKDRQHDSDERAADRQHQSELQSDELASQAALQDAERQHQEATQASERDHAKLLRRELDHANARDKFMPYAESVQDWVIVNVNRISNDDYAYTAGAEVARDLKSPAEVARALRRVARGHPSKPVREAEDSFHSSLQTAFSWVDMWNQNADGSYQEGPTDEQWFQWEKDAQQLVGLLHTDEVE